MSPSQISKWLLKHDTPFTEEDKNALALLSKTYPYFVPAKYIEAATYNSQHPFAPTILNKMRLYMGDWISFHQFLQETQAQAGKEPNRIQITDDLEEFKDDQPEYFFDTYEDEQEILKVEDQQLPDENFEEEDDFDFELFNEKVNEDQPFASFEARTERPKMPEAKGPTQTQSASTTEKVPIPEEKVVEQVKAEPITEESVGELLSIVAEETVIEEPEVIPEEKVDPEIIEEAIPQVVKEEKIIHVEEPLIDPVQIIEEKIAARPKEEPLIQPIYTEDYFLHQGISDISKEEEEDKSLMVVMSFSEWLMHFKTKTEKQKEEEEDQKALKTMWQKEKLAAALEEENEEIPENVFEMAVNSIKNEDDLVSESLAEIMIKQGKFDKAIDMYRKLSLRNPQKNAYFAGKIEKLIKER